MSVEYVLLKLWVSRKDAGLKVRSQAGDDIDEGYLDEWRCFRLSYDGIILRRA